MQIPNDTHASLPLFVIRQAVYPKVQRSTVVSMTLMKWSGLGLAEALSLRTSNHSDVCWLMEDFKGTGSAVGSVRILISV